MNSAATRKVTYFHRFRGSQMYPRVAGIRMHVSGFLMRVCRTHLPVAIYLINVSKQIWLGFFCVEMPSFLPYFLTL